MNRKETLNSIKILQKKLTAIRKKIIAEEGEQMGYEEDKELMNRPESWGGEVDQMRGVPPGVNISALEAQGFVHSPKSGRCDDPLKIGCKTKLPWGKGICLTCQTKVREHNKKQKENDNSEQIQTIKPKKINKKQQTITELKMPEPEEPIQPQITGINLILQTIRMARQMVEIQTLEQKEIVRLQTAIIELLYECTEQLKKTF